MPKFTYTGQTSSGKKVVETVDAADRYVVYEMARTKGHVVESVKQTSKFSIKKFLNVSQIEYYISRVSGDSLVILTRNISSMLVAGLPLSRSLSVIERQTKNPKLSRVVKEVKESIEQGNSFHEALAEHPGVFDDLYIAMVKAGEEGGSLAETLQVLSTQMERSSNLRKKIKGAMMYPTIVLIIMTIIGILMMIYVMPSITGTFRKLEVELPMMTQLLISISDFMVANTIVVIAGIIASVVGFIYFLRVRLGKIIFHWVFIHLPVIGTMVKETNSARTARTLSSLLTAGVDVVRALDITCEVLQNVYYKPIIKEALERVQSGTALSDVFVEHENLYPVFVGEMIMVGEETGQIAGMLEQLATFYENEVERKTKELSTIIEPILMVIIGGTVGFFALAMIAPIYSIGDSI